MAKFIDQIVGEVNFKPQASKERSGKAATTQTLEIKVAESAAQAANTNAIGVQTDSFETSKNVEFAPANPQKLAEFLKKVEPLAMKFCEEKLRRYDHLYWDSAGGQTSLTHALKQSSMPEGFQCIAVDWNCTGTTVMVACGHLTHDDWCAHQGRICTWNVERAKMNPANADLQLEFDTCATALSAHPTNPAYLAAGAHNGQILVWNLTMAETISAIGRNQQNTHTQQVTEIVWLEPKGSDRLCTCGLDGKVLVWAMPSRGNDLQVLQCFVVLTSHLPRSIRGNKVGGADKETGILCMAFPSANSESFIVGTETGGILQCSLNSKDPIGLNYEGVSDVPVYSPVVLPLNSHKGPINGLDFNRRGGRSPFFASVSSDGWVKIQQQLKPQPILSIETGGTKSITACRWSPIRPLVLAVGVSDGRVGLFDFMLTEDGPAQWLDADKSNAGILSLRWNPEKPQVLATGDGAGACRVWRLGDRYSGSLPAEENLVEKMSKLGKE